MAIMTTERKYAASGEDLAKLVALFNEVAELKEQVKAIKRSGRTPTDADQAVAIKLTKATQEFRNWFGVVVLSAVGPRLVPGAKSQAEQDITAQVLEAAGR